MTSGQRPFPSERHRAASRRAGRVVGVRIIAGRYRGRRLRYSGQLRTRPMKDRIREALFSILGEKVEGKFVVDLFAGTGALGLEALSRGAVGAVFLEHHRPTAALLRENIAMLGVQEQCQVLPVDTFTWFHRGPDLPQKPWLVFCSPPYEFYRSRQKQMLLLITGLIERALPESVFVVETDAHFDLLLLPKSDQWDVRHYRPTLLAIYQKS